MLITGLAAVILIFVVLTVVSAALGFAIWIVVVGLLRMMAKADPLMRRSISATSKYRSYYRPTSTPWRKY